MDNWVLIPCHNNSALLIDGLESILAQTINVRIFAIDNASKDNTPFVLNGLDHKHIVINRYPQLGVAGAWNYGLSYLYNTMGAERILVVNQDVILRQDTYETLLREEADFVTAVSTNERSALGTQTDTYRYYSRRSHPDFSCFLVSKNCYSRVGPFDEDFYPAWFEDNDYHIRAARAGIELYCIDLPFYHYAAGTMKNASEYDKAHYYGPGFLRSKKRFHEKWGVLPGTKEYEDLCNPKTYTVSTSIS